MGKLNGCVLLLLISRCIAFAQASSSDNSHLAHLPEITIKAKAFSQDNQSMPDVLGMMIFASKKANLIVPEKIQGNVANNSMRQIMAKVPGIHVWENDGSGIQIGIASRGLSPNRCWDFNIRQNGYDIAADPYGYPEAYYHPPMTGVQRIEVVRGHGALQYGPQLGGMVNYVLKDGSDLNKKWAGEFVMGSGSNRLLNVYAGNGVQWKNGYGYAFYDHRQGDGWRQNNRFNSEAGFITATQKISSSLKITGEIAISKIKSQQPGGLTDSLFQIDARKSLRSRNWMIIHWMTPAMNIQYAKTERFIWNTKIAATLGNRGSVGMISDLLKPDAVNSSTNEFGSRTVQIDRYQNIMAESRILYRIPASSQKNTISAGLRYFKGNTHRQSNGVGTKGSDAGLTVSNSFPTDIYFKSANYAVFAEGIFKLHPRLSMVPGFRYEWIGGSASGRSNIAADGKDINLTAQSRFRNFILPAFGTEYKLTPSVTLYANATAAYRPIQFSQLQVLSTTDSMDNDLKDSKGYNTDLGFKGQWGETLSWDISLFLLSYQNRVGTITLAGSTKRFITNVGASMSRGLESFVEWNVLANASDHHSVELKWYASYSYTDARYSQNNLAESVRGKRVENAPKHIFRSGFSFGYAWALLTTQYSYVHGSYSDANNTDKPSANGQSGFIPAYRIWDMTLQCDFTKKIQFKTGINNLFDTRYFTRRSGGYPGPGLLPGDGRSCFLTFSTRLN